MYRRGYAQLADIHFDLPRSHPGGERTDPPAPLDADLQVPDTGKSKGHTNWQPEIQFEKTMQDLLVYCRERSESAKVFLTRGSARTGNPHDIFES
jgi:hypothetical protein